MVLSQETMAWRDKGIGGSDARTIAEGSGDDWQRLKDEKLNGIRPVFSKQQRFLMDLGTAVEPVVLDYINANVITVALRNQPSHMKADPWFRCILDGITTLDQPIQCKFHTGDKDLGDLAEYYWAQLQHELLVTGAKQLLFAAAFGHYGQFDHMMVDADQTYQNGYMALALKFKAYCWQDAPLPDGLFIADNRPVPEVPRLRHHVWPIGDNTVGPLAQAWLNNRPMAELFNEAAAGLKKQVPEDCKTASWLDVNGSGIQISVSKSGAKTIKPHVVRS